jgi:hypothetical protein
MKTSNKKRRNQGDEEVAPVNSGYPTAMAFWHEQGLVPAWKFAEAFAGKGGRIATLPDIIEARLHSKPDAVPWDKYLTTNSAEYVGMSKGGNKIIIVAHGVGPMSTLEGAQQAYSHHEKNGARNGGRITRAEFLKLESGKYGEVQIVDFEEVVSCLQNSFNRVMTSAEIQKNPLAKARLGKNWHNYVLKHDEIAFHNIRIIQGRKVPDLYMPNILQSNHAGGDCSYEYTKIKRGEAFAHLLSISAVSNHDVTCDVKCHGLNDGTRFVGIRKEHDFTENVFLDGPSTNCQKCLIERYWRNLLVPAGMQHFPTLRRLTTINDSFFALYSKNTDPEFFVKSVTVIGEPVRFKMMPNSCVDTTDEQLSLHKIETNTVESLVPKGASAYTLQAYNNKLEEGERVYKIQYYDAKIDFSKCLPRQNVILNDYQTLVKLIDKDFESF